MSRRSAPPAPALSGVGTLRYNPQRKAEARTVTGPLESVTGPGAEVRANLALVRNERTAAPAVPIPVSAAKGAAAPVVAPSVAFLLPTGSRSLKRTLSGASARGSRPRFTNP